MFVVAACGTSMNGRSREEFIVTSPGVRGRVIGSNQRAGGWRRQQKIGHRARCGILEWLSKSQERVRFGQVIHAMKAFWLNIVV